MDVRVVLALLLACINPVAPKKHIYRRVFMQLFDFIIRILAGVGMIAHLTISSVSFGLFMLSFAGETEGIIQVAFFLIWIITFLLGVLSGFVYRNYPQKDG